MLRVILCFDCIEVTLMDNLPSVLAQLCCTSSSKKRFHGLIGVLDSIRRL